MGGGHPSKQVLNPLTSGDPLCFLYQPTGQFCCMLQDLVYNAWETCKCCYDTTSKANRVTWLAAAIGKKVFGGMVAVLKMFCQCDTVESHTNRP